MYLQKFHFGPLRWPCEKLSAFANIRPLATGCMKSILREVSTLSMNNGIKPSEEGDRIQMVNDIQISDENPYKSSVPFRFFSLDKVTNKATCLVNGCGRQIKIFNFSPKEVKNYLTSKFHKLSEQEIYQSTEIRLDKFIKKARVEGLIDEIAWCWDQVLIF